MSSPAPALLTLKAQLLKAYPGMKSGDLGIMGDARHQATASDHNQGNALDIPVEGGPGAGGPMTALAEALLSDGRGHYAIYNRRIKHGGGGWTPYSGVSSHTDHIHLSINAGSRGDGSPWALSGSVVAPPVALAKSSTPGNVVVHRLYRVTEDEHFYTESVGEAIGLISPTCHYEGAAWEYDPAVCTIPVVRLRHNKSGLHHWTSSFDEAVGLTHRDWFTEGRAFSCKASGTPVYRLIHNKTGRHFWTASKPEFDMLQHQDWRAEGPTGIAFYV